MIVRLTDILGDFIRVVEVPDAVLPKISALTFDGVPYVRQDAETFQMVNGYYATRGHVAESIDMGRIFERPIVHELRTTRWFSGISGEALFDIDVTIAIPWADSFTIRIRDTRPIRLNNLWCPEWPGETQHGIPNAVRAAFVQSSKCRSLTNEFCNSNRPRGTKLMAAIAGIDTMSRLIVDITKVIPPIGSKTPELRLSLQEHLLNSRLFQPASWRTK